MAKSWSQCRVKDEVGDMVTVVEPGISMYTGTNTGNNMINV